MPSDSIDKLFESLVDILIIIFEKGLVNVSIEVSENDICSKYLKDGIDLIKEGKMPSYVEVILEYNFINYIKESTISDSSLMKLLILKKALPFIQKRDLESFMELNENFYSMPVKVNNDTRLEKYLTD